MQIVRTIVWVLLLAALLVFSIANWQPTVTVRIWEGLVIDTKIPAIVVISFLIGLLPMWLLHLGTRWHLRRRISSLENAARTAAMTPIAPTPAPDAEPELEAVPAAGQVIEAEPAPAQPPADRAPPLDEHRPKGI